MRLVILLFGLFGHALAGVGKPEITIGINSDAFDKGALAALAPNVKWQSSGSFSGCDVDGGVELTMHDVDDMPYSVWGRVKRTVSGIALSAKVNTKSTTLNSLWLDLQASGPTGTSVQVTGVAKADEPSIAIGNLKVSQKIDTSVGKFTVTPTYNLGSSKGDVKLTYGRADTVVTIDADLDKQKLTVSQAIGDKNVVTPSIASDGNVSLEYTRSVGTGAVTAGYKPDSYVALSYEDGPWMASVKAPIEGLYKVTDAPKFNIRRSVDITAGAL